MKQFISYLFVAIFLFSTAGRCFSFPVTEITGANQAISVHKKITSGKVYDKQHSESAKSIASDFSLTDDDFQFSDTSLIPLFASAAVIFGVALHLFFTEKIQFPSPLFSLNRNVNRRYILLENLRI